MSMTQEGNWERPVKSNFENHSIKSRNIVAPNNNQTSKTSFSKVDLWIFCNNIL